MSLYKIITSQFAGVSSWYLVIAFIFLCVFCFEQTEYHRREERTKLNAYLHQLQQQKTRALAENKNLLLQVNSESDPAWVEIVLMQKLGLVPENYTKVYFKSY